MKTCKLILFVAAAAAVEARRGNVRKGNAKDDDHKPMNNETTSSPYAGRSLAASSPSSKQAAAANYARYVQLHDEDYIMDFDRVYLQNNFEDFRWLTGGRDASAAGVYTRNQLGSDSEAAMKDYYEWWVSVPSRSGCLKFGDVWEARHDAATGFIDFLRLVGSEGIQTLWGTNERNRERWQVRSRPGSGEIVTEDDGSDPLYGQCIEANTVVYIQNMFLRNRWLSGSRGSNDEAVIGRNIYQNADERERFLPTYQWIMRKGLGSGYRSDGLRCPALMGASVGQWTVYKYANAGQKITYEEGITRSSEESVTNTKQWQTSVTRSVAAGFELKGFSAGTSVEVSFEYGESMESSVRSAVEKTQMASYETVFDEPGQIWQFRYFIRDACYPDTWSMATKDLVITKGRFEPPCCLPGYALDPRRQHGPCAAGSPCMCSDEVCNSQP